MSVLSKLGAIIGVLGGLAGLLLQCADLWERWVLKAPPEIVMPPGVGSTDIEKRFPADPSTPPSPDSDPLRRLAEQGDATAQTALGRHLLIKRDIAGAHLWWTRASQAGHTEATYYLGQLLYLFGTSAAKKSEGAQLIAQAADHGLVRAQTDAGALAVTHRRSRADVEAGIRWLESAAQSGETLAMRNLIRIYGQGVPEFHVARNVDQKQQWCRRLQQATREIDVLCSAASPATS